MALVRSSRTIAATAERVWQQVTDWHGHGRWVPFTTVRIDPGSPGLRGLGTRFTGRSGLGPIAFDDPMTVTEWQPPSGEHGGHCRIEHRGPWIHGWAQIEVTPAGAGSRLTWIEDVRPRWTPRFLDPVIARIGRVLFDGTLRKLAAELDG